MTKRKKKMFLAGLVGSISAAISALGFLGAICLPCSVTFLTLFGISTAFFAHSFHWIFLVIALASFIVLLELILHHRGRCFVCGARLKKRKRN